MVVENIRASLAETPAPTPGIFWIGLTDSQRKKVILDVLPNSHRKVIEILEAKQNGDVIIKMLGNAEAEERGSLLLAIENLFAVKGFDFVYVYLEPAQDKNRLRKLRGVTVK